VADAGLPRPIRARINDLGFELNDGTLRGVAYFDLRQNQRLAQSLAPGLRVQFFRHAKRANGTILGGIAFEDGSIGLNIDVPRARQLAVAAHEFGHVLEARNVSAYQAIHDYVLADLPEGKFQELESELISLGYSMEEITPERTPFPCCWPSAFRRTLTDK